MNGQRQQNPDELGGLWIKDGQRGEFMTGEINGVKVICFRNDRKRPGSQAPDWRVLRSTRQGGETRSAPQESRPAPQQQTLPKPKPSIDESEWDNDAPW